jgi:hypothetical protein
MTHGGGGSSSGGEDDDDGREGFIFNLLQIFIIVETVGCSARNLHQ